MRWRDLGIGALMLIGQSAVEAIRIWAGYPSHLTFTEVLIIACTGILLCAIRESKGE